MVGTAIFAQEGSGANKTLYGSSRITLNLTQNPSPMIFARGYYGSNGGQETGEEFSIFAHSNNGSITFDNHGGELDYLIALNIYGFTIDLYYLDDRLETPSRTDLQNHYSFYAKNKSLSLKDIIIQIQDKRQSKDADFPNEYFNTTDYPDIDDEYDGDIIPVLYGEVFSSESIPVDGNDTGTVDYRQALFLTSLGTVQVLIDEVWTTKVPTATDEATGSFTLAQADGRKGGAADGQPYKCRVLGSVGFPVTYASDVIKHLNLYYLILLEKLRLEFLLPFNHTPLFSLSFHTPQFSHKIFCFF
jgi:hypothetical protein